MPEHFFIVGAQRAATSYLYQLLAEHPEIEMAKPIRPEPKFFFLDQLFERGLGYYQKTYFERKTSARIHGEKSTSYMESEKAAQRISETFPDAKIIFLFRDPIDRAVSHYWFSVKNGLENLPIEEAFLREEERWMNYDHKKVSVSPYAYLSRGRYMDYIRLYERYFPFQNIKVLLHEKLINSVEPLRDLYRFLGISDDFIPPSIGQLINPGEKSLYSLPDDLEDYLLGYFRGWNEQLGEYLNEDLTGWRNCNKSPKKLHA